MKRYKPPNVEWYVRQKYQYTYDDKGIPNPNLDLMIIRGISYSAVVPKDEWEKLLQYVSRLESEIEYHRARLGLPGGVDRSQPEPVRRPPILVEAPDVTGLPQVQPGRSRASPVRKPSPGQIAAPRPYDPGRRPPLPSWPRVRPGRP